MNVPSRIPRIVIEKVSPEVEGGRYPVKRIVGERLAVEADIYAEGDAHVMARLLYRRTSAGSWSEVPLSCQSNDRWRGEFRLTAMGRYHYTIKAWVDDFATWRMLVQKRLAGGEYGGGGDEELELQLREAMELVEAARHRASGDDRRRLAGLLAEAGPHGGGARAASAAPLDLRARFELFLDPAVAELVARHPDPRRTVVYERELLVEGDRERARFGAWYQMFPRSEWTGAEDAGAEGASAGGRPPAHATLRDCLGRLAYVAEMGFDVLCLPPIHPIGLTHRKGRNDAIEALPGDPGSPWAVGGAAGGHKAVHPELGTLDDFRELVARAKELGLELALDVALQCSPDHPYVRDHVDWFPLRPDGSLRPVENAEREFPDIVALDFEAESRAELWEELRSIFTFWIGQDIRIFRVDSPHTKPFAFWEWLLPLLEAEHPDLIFLAGAFTRHKAINRLAKIGFTQSYTHFPWKHTRWEIASYAVELTRSEAREFLHPNFWVNTPDILPRALSEGGRPAFMARLALAATMGASYGVYGPAFELCERRAGGPSGEAYLDSEKYELRRWEVGREDSLKPFIAQVNRIRRENPALRGNERLVFHAADNELLLAYSKHTEDRSGIILGVVSLDPYHPQEGWVQLDLASLGIGLDEPFTVHDLLTDTSYSWRGSRNFVRLDPAVMPAHIFRVRRQAAGA